MPFLQILGPQFSNYRVRQTGLKVITLVMKTVNPGPNRINTAIDSFMWTMIWILLIKKGKQGDRVNNLWGKGKGEMQLAPLLLTPKLRGRGPASPSTQVGELWKSLANLMTQRLIPQWGL